MLAKCFDCLKMLSVKSRFEIFEYLKEKKKATVSELVKLTSLRQPTVTFHIGQLEKVGVLKKKQVGREVFCVLKKKCPTCPLL